ncbi:Shedu anti-phage system protein SduA domain-containing protein [Amycolatopsis sp. CB00013]|uniref:Shedu anti-phage system protein SduA domain-containing protein n=1 Tax=Amycolatopsis sp. CB00013 TaxID=1703945 RepID=UPI001160EBF3|nr:Shedu anti-phage system protein SduA domain-containing protein [Amycolatopsis sp. CB00013]
MGDLAISFKDVTSAAKALELRIRSGPLPPGCLRIETAVVRKGPQAYKTATLWFFGDSETGELKKRTLSVQSWNAREGGGGFDFTEKANSWACDNDEIDALLAFLSGQIDEPGLYRRVGDSEALAQLVACIEAGKADAEQIAQMVQALADAPNADDVLARHGAGQVLLDGIQFARQRDVISELTAAVEDPSAREGRFQKALEDNWWMFGGKFIDKASRRAITVLDQLDIPLIRADGALHVIELKTANVPDLVIKYRNHFVAGPAVNEAVGQVMNYLRELDEQRHTIKGTLGIECRRAFATVVIGHPSYVKGATQDEISETLRTYNSHLSRVEVITYGDLIQGAQGALDLARA